LISGADDKTVKVIYSCETVFGLKNRAKKEPSVARREMEWDRILFQLRMNCDER
jgi:hypothetical protein